MKKVLSLVLVALLAIGMGSAAFAGYLPIEVNLENIKQFAGTYTLIDGYSGGYAVSRDTGNYNAHIKMGNVYAQDDPEVIVNLWAHMFNTDYAPNTTITTAYEVDVQKMVNSGVIYLDSTYPTVASVYAGGWTALEYLLGKNTSYVGAANLSKAGVLAGITTSYQNWVNSKWTATTYGALNAAELIAAANAAWDYATSLVNSVPEALLRAYNAAGFLRTSDASTATLTFDTGITGLKIDGKATKAALAAAAPAALADMLNITGLVWTGVKYIGAPTTNSTNRVLTSNEINKSNIRLQTLVSGNSTPIRDCELQAAQGRVRLRVKNEWVSTGNQDFEITFYLSINGTRYEDHAITVTGNLRNKSVQVPANMDYVNIEEGYVIEPTDFNQSINVYIGNGITIHTKLFKDKKYYGITSRASDEEATVVFKQYVDVDNVVILKTVGFANTGDKVSFSTDYSGYYVYDENMNYLGKADERVDFSTRYYLANRQLDIESDEGDDEPDDEPTSGGNPTTGGDVAPPNVNANPGTGR